VVVATAGRPSGTAATASDTAERRADEAAAQAIELTLERRRRCARLGHEGPDPAQLAVAAQIRHAGNRRALGHRRARVHHVPPVAERGADGTEDLRGLRDGEALAGERRLVDREAVGGEQSRIRGDVVAGTQDDEVARRQRGRRHHVLDAVAQDDRLGNGRVLQRGENALDAAFGHVADGGVGGDHGEDHGGVEDCAAEQRQRRGTAEQDHRERGEMIAHDRRAGFWPVRRQDVAPVGEAASLGLVHRESRLRRRREAIDDLLGLERVPRGLAPMPVAVAARARGRRLAADRGEQLPHVESPRIESDEHASGDRIRRDAVDRGVTRESCLDGVGEGGRAAQDGQTHANTAGNGEGHHDDSRTAAIAPSHGGGHTAPPARPARRAEATSGSRRRTA